jgi:hypothetical protein
MVLRWDQVNFENAVVRLDAGESKSEGPREFPFTGELKTMLEAQGRKADALLEHHRTVTEFVFFHKDARRIRDFRKSWRSARKAAGLAEVKKSEHPREASRS